MKRLVALAVVAAFAAGLIGTWVFNQITESAGAAPPLQVREDQITIWSEGASGFSLDQPVVRSPQYTALDSTAALWVGIDAQDYPPSATFRLETVWFGSSATSPSTRCFRLFDRTGNTPVAGSEVCHIASSTPNVLETVRLRSLAFALPVGEHEYEVQAKSTAEPPADAADAFVNAGRIIAEWTERSR